jgi:acetyl-CoA synthetase
METSPSVETCVVVRRAGNDIEMKDGRDCWWHREVNAADISSFCEPESMDAEDMLFILYTSGSTGKPKGVVHTTGGYLTYAMHTAQWVFDLKDSDVYWCTADLRLDHRPQLHPLRTAGIGCNRPHVRRGTQLSGVGSFLEDR